MAIDNEYNPADCFTAGQLRAMRIAIPETIPDCGWIKKYNVRFGDVKVGGDGNVLNIEMGVTFLAAFQWVEVPIKIIGKDES